MLYFDKQIGDVRIAVWHVTEDYDELLSLLPDADLVRSEAEANFSSKSRIIEWTAVRVLLCCVLGRQIEILYTDDGKPMLHDYEELNISISHTKGYVAIALSEKTPVGIDVEQMEPDVSGDFLAYTKTELPRIWRVKNRFVRDDETANTTVGLLLHWSAKESVFKVLERNRVNFVDDLKVYPFDEMQYEGGFEVEDLKKHDMYHIKYKVFEEFVLTYTKMEDDE